MAPTWKTCHVTRDPPLLIRLICKFQINGDYILFRISCLPQGINAFHHEVRLGLYEEPLGDVIVDT